MVGSVPSVGGELKVRHGRVHGTGGPAATVESLESRTLFAAGALDTTFNGTGKVTAKYRATNDAIAVAFQSDGKAVVVGDTQGTGKATKDAFVSRYNVNGTADTTFGSGGKVFLSLGSDEIATAVAIQPDGKIVVAGVTGTLSKLKGDFFVARYNTNGTLDTTFNSTGTKIIDFGGADAASGVAVTGNGRIIVVGTSLLGIRSGQAIAFLNPDGSFDTTFGPGDFVQPPPSFGVFEGALGIALAPIAGRFYTAGFQLNLATGKSRFMVSEFNIDGSFVTAWGSQGRAFASFGKNLELARGIAVDPTTNKVVAAGVSANGVIELSPGFPITKLPTRTATSAVFGVARFNTDGTLDTSFNGKGTTTTAFKTKNAVNLSGASGVVVQPDSKVVASGGSQVRATGLSVFATARYNSNGSLDTTFGKGGLVTTSFSSTTSDGPFGMGLQSDGKIYEVGHSKKNASNGAVALVRYNGS